MGWRPVPGPTTGWLNRREPWPSLFLNTDDSDYKSWLHEVQLQGLTGRVNWILGVFNLKEDNEIVFDVELPFCCTQGAAGGISFIQPERKLDSEAIFGQATWHATDKWHFTAGGRYYEDTKQDVGGRNIGCFGSSGCSFSRGQIPNDGFPQTEDERDPLLLPQFTSADLGPGMGSQDRFNNYELLDKNDNKEDFSSFDWRLGVDYDLTSDAFLYLYAARGSKAGSLGDGVDVCRCGRIEFFNFDPEEVLNYELGYKGSLFDNKVSLRAALFFTDYKDKQVTQFRNVGFVEDPPGNILQPPQEIGTQVTSNAGAAEIIGFELEWDIIPWANGRIGGGIGVLDSEITEWDGYLGEIQFCEDREDVSPAYACIPADEDSPGEPGVVGNELPYAVPVTFTVTYEHNFTMPGGYRLTPWTKFHWEDEMHFTEGNFDDLDAYSDKRDDFAIVDATLRLTSPRETWHVEAFVYNITDERFPTYYQLDRPTAGAPLYAWNEPRTWGMRFSYNISP
jgi:iron complex outermembrane receptor protein